MMRSLFSGVSGLKNHQTRMDVIGNNISNVNTTGFKSARATFTDMLSQTLSGAAAPTGNIGGVNPKQIGLGSSTSAIETLFTNGSVQSTGKNTDLCLSSENALFILNTGSGTAYTRNGAFEFDADGNYVQAGNGYKVLGWMAGSTGELVTTGDADVIKIPSGKTMAPAITENAVYSNNLNANTQGYEISSITAKYEDGTSETLTSYPSGVITLETSGGGKIQLDKTAEYDFTTGDSVKDKLLFTTEIQSATASTGATLDLGVEPYDDSVSSITDSAGNPVTFTGVSSGTYAIGDKIGIQGTIQTNGVTTSGTGTGQTCLTVKLTQPTAAANMIVKIYVPTPQDFSYADGQSVSFDLAIKQIDAPQGATVTTPRGDIVLNAKQIDSSQSTSGTTTNKLSITKKDQELKRYGLDSEGTVTAVDRVEKTAESVVITTKDGQTLNGLTGMAYKSGNMFYPSIVTSTTVYDSLGGAHDVSILLTRDSNEANTWKLSLPGGKDTIVVTEPDGTETTITLTSKDLKFTTSGVYESGEATLKMSYTNPDPKKSAADQTVAVNFSSVTQYASSNTIAANTDGNAAGTLSSISIDTSGTITGTYTNGMKRAEAQVALQRFTNPAGLTKIGDSLYEDSNNAGKSGKASTAAEIGAKITPAALEMSNVDVADQFTDMIVTQRGFQSNSKIITVSDEMLETLINMKR